MIILAGDTPLPPKQGHRQLRPCCCCWEQGAEPRAECLPLSEESATRVFDVLQLKETRPHQQRLDVLLIYGQMTIVGKVDQSLKSTKQGGEKRQNLLTINLTGDTTERNMFSGIILAEGRPRPVEGSGSFWASWTLPGIHPLHDDLILLALHHVVSEHGVEVGDRSCQHDPVSAEFMVPYLKKGREKGEEGRSAPFAASPGDSLLHSALSPAVTAGWKSENFHSQARQQLVS